MAKKLGDLYSRGKPLEVQDDDNADSVVVYISKINPVEQEEAVRAGNAKQAVVLAGARDHESPQWMAVQGRALMKSTEDLIERLVEEKRVKIEPVCDSKVAHEDEWHKEGYLDGLRDAWANGVQGQYSTDPTDPEAAQVFGELQRFTAQLEAALAAEINPYRRDLEDLSLERLQEEWCEAELKLRGLITFNIEYFRQCLLAAVREPCDGCAVALANGEKHASTHARRYFAAAEEVDALDIHVRSVLQSAYSDLSVNGTEGKDSPPQAASSPSSVPADREATAASSGPMDVAA